MYASKIFITLYIDKIEKILIDSWNLNLWHILYVAKIIQTDLFIFQNLLLILFLDMFIHNHPKYRVWRVELNSYLIQQQVCHIQKGCFKLGVLSLKIMYYWSSRWLSQQRDLLVTRVQSILST